MHEHAAEAEGVVLCACYSRVEWAGGAAVVLLVVLLVAFGGFVLGAVLARFSDKRVFTLLRTRRVRDDAGLRA